MRISLHIPVAQYGFVQIDEVDESDVERLYNKYAEKSINLSPTGKLIEAFCGGQIMYDEATHTYSWSGEKYLSGSEYAKSFDKPFDAEKISEAMAKRDGTDAEALRSQWQLKADISSGYGTALHAALEMWIKHKEVHPTFQKPVESFFEGKDASVFVSEVVVVDHATKQAGRIDLINIVGQNECVIRDFKTGKMDVPKRKTYLKQLEFYKGIMEAASWVVKGIYIDHWDGEVWATYDS